MSILMADRRRVCLPGEWRQFRRSRRECLQELALAVAVGLILAALVQVGCAARRGLLAPARTVTGAGR